MEGDTLVVDARDMVGGGMTMTTEELIMKGEKYMKPVEKAFDRFVKSRAADKAKAKAKAEAEAVPSKAPALFKTAANFVSNIPAFVLLLLGVGAALMMTTGGIAALKSNALKKTLGPSAYKLVGWIKGTDVTFVIAYFIAAFSIALLLILVTFLARIPVSAIVGILLSSMGIMFSVMIEVVCRSMDDDNYKKTQYTPTADINRRLFLHGPMGAAVAFAVVMMADIGPAGLPAGPPAPKRE